MSSISSDYGLLLIDIQQGFNHPSHWGRKRSTPNFEENVAELLATFREVAPENIFHVCHYSTLPHSPLHPSNGAIDFQPYAAPLPSEPTFPKHKNSGFVGTNLEAAIRERKITTLVVCGLMTEHCVSSTLRQASDLGVVDGVHGEDSKGRILLVQDATGSYDTTFGGRYYDAETVHSVHLSGLDTEFCQVVNLKVVLRELRGQKENR
ncbi:isochorismatase hydrolase [Trichoderma arundinaceum]|uniref:Isochorismatase hydrolase n=1 Tax=Trichoderma arundinaceum TaxID=490622 RepID=A0A395NCU2_TRIAR|nr:isochorismatase hydrolase [Trichoderma arundinaceum]